MRLDLVTEKAIEAEISWEVLDLKHKHTSMGLVRFSGIPKEAFRLRLVRTRFGGGISIYPVTDEFTAEQLDKYQGLANALPLPDALSRFVGGNFTLDGAPGGQLQMQHQAIELIGEVPKGYKGHASREALYRSLTAEETRGVFGALGMDLTDHEFDSFEEIT